MGGGSKSQTVGYKYYLGLQFMLCYGPIKEMFGIKIGDRTAYQSINAGGPDDNITSSAEYIVKGKTELFGGEDHEGGVGAFGRKTYSLFLSVVDSGRHGSWNRISKVHTGTKFNNMGGDFNVKMGSDSQTVLGYLDNQISGEVPAYRGICHVTAKKFYIGNNAYLKPWEFNVSRYPSMPTSTVDEIGDDANPAHMMYELMNNVDWGMGYPQSAFDLPSFASAAQTLSDEGLGLSMIWSASDSIESFISNILDHIDGSLYLDTFSGLFVMQLVRDDYDINTLQIFDESNIVDMQSFSRRGWGETINELTVVYKDGATNKNIPLTTQDMANITLQGTTINKETSYPGISNGNLATQIALRDLRVLSAPLARVKFRVNKQAWDLAVGQVFKLVWPKYGLNEVVFRVGTLDFGNLNDGHILVTCIEDVFALPTNTYTSPEPSGFVEPLIAPVDAVNRIHRELGYWEVVQLLGEQAGADIPDGDGFMASSATKPTGSSYEFILFVRATGFTGEFDEIASGDFAAYAEFTTELAAENETINVVYENGIDMDEILLGTLCQINDEWVVPFFHDPDTFTISFYRGMLDTLPVIHAIGSKIFSSGENVAINDTQYTDGEQLDIRLLPSTGAGTLQINDASQDQLTFDGRMHKPLAPANLRVEGLPAFVAQGMTAGVFNILWTHRDRLQQTGDFVYQDDGDIGPEAGVTYDLRLYNEDDVLSHTEAAFADNFYDWTDEVADSGIGGLNSLIKMELDTNRGGDTAYQNHVYSFRRADYGYSYGMFYGGFV